METLTKYFPAITPGQLRQFEMLGPLYTEWNAKINVVSRKDIDALYLHHVVHSLGIAKFFTPADGAQFIDLGCGGGFPGIPLAIMWPQCRFHLIDRIGKKVKVAQAVAEAVGLENVTFQHGDMGECKVMADYIVSRAVMQLDELVKISAKNVKKLSRKASAGHNVLPPGLICLKGGDLSAELGRVKRPKLVVPLSDWFSEEYFKDKDVVYVEI